MTLDTERQRVLVVFRNPPKFAAFSWQTGDVVSEIDTCGDADDLFLDAKRKRVYITCGTGFIDVLKADESKYSRVYANQTVAGARTGLIHPRNGSAVFSGARSAAEPAAIWIYRGSARDKQHECNHGRARSGLDSALRAGDFYSR